MRSLSPGPSRYSSFSAGPCGAGFLSASLSLSLAASGASVQTVNASAAARVVTCLLFMALTSVLIGGRVKAAPPVDDRVRQGLTFEGVGIDGVGRIAGGTDRDPHLRREFVILDAGDQPVDDALGV